MLRHDILNQVEHVFVNCKLQEVKVAGIDHSLYESIFILFKSIIERNLRLGALKLFQEYNVLEFKVSQEGYDILFVVVCYIIEIFL